MKKLDLLHIWKYKMVDRSGKQISGFLKKKKKLNLQLSHGPATTLLDVLEKKYLWSHKSREKS